MKSRPLAELDPHWSEDGCLIFDCPVCPQGCCLGVPTREPLRPGGPVWGWNGELDFTKVTLTPSIDYTKGDRCPFHGWVTNGVVTWL